MTPKSRVYVLLDSESRILRLEGEYSLPVNLDGWTKIDEGNGDKYALAQSHYLSKPLYDGAVLRYKLVDGKVVERTAEEIEADKAKLPKPEPTAEDDTNAMIVDHEYRLTLLELGLNEGKEQTQCYFVL